MIKLANSPAGPDPALRVDGLSVSLVATGTPIVRGVSFEVESGEILCLVGESGAGKSSTAMSLLGAPQTGTTITGGHVWINGGDLLAMSERKRRSIRGRTISAVLQDPATALNPSMRIDEHITRTLRAHDYPGSRGDRIHTLLASVALSPTVSRRYPHQLSGGQQQRALIAIALACSPRVVVMDEPTTGLDVTTQAQILNLVKRLRAEEGLSVVYVTHDLAVVSELADRVAVMYGGQAVEVGSTLQIFETPAHPYTKMLLRSIPRVGSVRTSLVGIPGRPPGPGAHGMGCSFMARCPWRQPPCGEPQELEFVAQHHEVRCVRWRDLAVGTLPVSPKPVNTIDQTVARTDPTLLAATAVSARYPGSALPAVSDATFDVFSRECLAIVGESGSGKTTIARCLAGLHHDWSGSLLYKDELLASTPRGRGLQTCRAIQIVFQNPDRSLNPRHTVGDLIARPAIHLLEVSREEAHARTQVLLEEVRLPARYLHSYPRELSGGERQRVALARALICNPELLICDEVTSALDVSIQASILELLGEFTARRALSMIFISHDLGVVRSIADRILVMHDGRIREQGDADRVFAEPSDDYTAGLLAAVPRAEAVFARRDAHSVTATLPPPGHPGRRE